MNMATVSIEKGISLNKNAVENILKVFEEKNDSLIKKDSLVDAMQEVKRGNDILSQLFSH